MSFRERVKDFSEKLENRVELVEDLDNTKSSLVMPFFKVLGYDIFNPEEFKVGYKDGEIDFTVLKDGEILMAVRCGSCTEPVNSMDISLVECDAKYEVFTNGVEYQIYQGNENDLAVLTRSPILTVNLLKLDERSLNGLERFTKEKIGKSNEIEHIAIAKEILEKEFKEPSKELVDLVLAKVDYERKSADILEKYPEVVKKAFKQLVRESRGTIEEGVEVGISHEELEAFWIIRGILEETVGASKVTYRQLESYLGIMLEDNNRRTICRLYLGKGRKKIAIPLLPIAEKGSKKFETLGIDDILDIYKYKDRLVEVAKSYVGE